MPNVGGKKFPYTDEGKAAAKEEAAKSGKKMTMGYKAGGDVKKKKRVTNKDKLAAKKAKGAKLATNTTATPRKMVAENNTMPPVPKPQAAAAPNPMGGMTGGAPKPPMMAGAGAGAGGMGAKMPMMKKGGKVKKAKSYGKGGKVRGAGIAKKGVKKCKMR